MADVKFYPPHPAAIARMVAIPNTTIAPAMLAFQEGPDGDLGPEQAGAVLMLHTTFIDEDRARHFWNEAARLMELLASAPGFIRRFSFGDGRSMYLIALWRTVEDAKAFAAGTEHRKATRALYKERWQYSHFSAIWEMNSTHDRIIFCDRCDAITPVSQRVCSGCGEELTDVFAPTAPPVG